MAEEFAIESLECPYLFMSNCGVLKGTTKKVISVLYECTEDMQ